jgi:hypothetical protein
MASDWESSALLEPLCERLAIEILEHEKVDRVLGRARRILMTDVVQRADMRVVETRDRLRFQFKPLLHCRVRRDMLRQDLDGDGAIETSVLRLVDLPHAAGAKRGEDLIRSDACAWRQHLEILNNPETGISTRH